MNYTTDQRQVSNRSKHLARQFGASVLTSVLGDYVGINPIVNYYLTLKGVD